jgi:hypothetical protein
VRSFKVIEIVIIKTSLADNGGHQDFYHQPADLNGGLASKKNSGHDQNRNEYKYTFPDYKKDVANGIILFKNTKHIFFKNTD